VFGAKVPVRRGWDDVSGTIRWLASRWSNCTDYRFELVTAASAGTWRTWWASITSPIRLMTSRSSHTRCERWCTGLGARLVHRRRTYALLTVIFGSGWGRRRRLASSLAPDRTYPLRVARPGFPDCQLERHGMRRHSSLTFGLSARLAGCRAQGRFSSSPLGPMTAGLSSTQIFRYVPPRFARAVTRASVPFRFLRARPLADRSPMWSHLAARAPQSSFCARWEFVQCVEHSRCLSR